MADDKPRYRILNSPGFFAEDDTLYPPGTEIVYLGTPNEHMEPLNDAAREAVDKHTAYLDQCYAEKMHANGRAVGVRPRELGDQIAEASAEAREKRERKVYPTAGQPIPPMGNMSKRKGPAKNIVSAKTPKPAGKQEAKVITPGASI